MALLIITKERDFIKEGKTWRECIKAQGYTVQQCTHAWIAHIIHRERVKGKRVQRYRIASNNLLD